MHEELINKFDIVYQLRRVDQPYPTDTMLKAADEIERLRALTAPQAETCKRCGGDGREVDYETGQSMTCPCTWQNQKPWTRKDGSATPRGDVVDRRKSEYGNYREAPGSIPRRCQIPERDFYGRRSGDRARWTAPVQETPQTLLAGLYSDQKKLDYGKTADMYAVFRVAEAVSNRIVDIERKLSELDRKLSELDRRSAGK